MSVILPDELCEMLGLECNVGASRTRKVVIDNVTKRINSGDKFVLNKLKGYTGEYSPPVMLDRLKEMVKILPPKQKTPKEDILPTEVKVSLSEDLRRFLKCDEEKMSVDQILKSVIDYIDKHGLQCQTIRRNIIPDDNLRRLLGVSNDHQLTFFNVHEYLKRHYYD